MKSEEQEELKNIINNNNYIKKCKSNKNKDISSLSYFYSDLDLSQSELIKEKAIPSEVLQKSILFLSSPQSYSHILTMGKWFFNTKKNMHIPTMTHERARKYLSIKEPLDAELEDNLESFQETLLNYTSIHVVDDNALVLSCDCK